jgi:GxxExxY protein
MQEVDVMAELMFKEEVYQIVAAAIEVHRELGSGFAEAVYHEAMEIELKSWNVPFESCKVLRISYKGQLLEKSYVADIICFDTIVVELKALDRLSDREESQLLNYLKATNLRVGLLINFGAVGKLEWRRFIK